jgi:hypothetical protein
MDIHNLGEAVTSSPTSIIAFSLAALAILALFGIKPFLKRTKIKDVGWDLPAVMLVLVASMTAGFGFSHNMGLEVKATEKAFTEQLKNDYGFTTDSDFEEVRRSARHERIVVFTDEKGDFEVRPHLDGSILTFFRVDNGAQLNPKS